ncbi:tape measure protein [Oceanobacillus sp. FSL K6-3682]|uniref:phage tail protein n=1 Tax=Oceanobacillus sp. FSL K6-3682 TaxID=2921503 RepID=UPI0030D8D0BB
MADGKIVIDKQLDRVSKSGNQANVSLGQMLKSIHGIAKSVDVFNLFEGSISSAVKQVDTLNNANKVFQNMGFSASASASMLDNLVGSITGLSTPLEEAVQGVQMLALTTGDLEGSQQLYSAMNNAIIGFGGSSEQVKGTVQQLSQAFANSKVDGGAWNNMIANGMSPALQALAKDMGYTMGELESGLSEGTISVEAFQDGLIKLNEEGGGGLAALQQIALDATDGIGTGIDSARTAVASGIAAIINSINSLLSDNGLPSIGQIIEGIGGLFESAFKIAADVMTPVIGLLISFALFLEPLAPLIIGIAAAFGTYLTIVGTLVQVQLAIIAVNKVMELLNTTMFKSPFVIVTSLIVGLIAALIYLYQTNETVRNAMQSVWSAIQEFIIPIVQAIVDFVMNLWGLFVEWWEVNNQAIFDTLQNIWSTIVEFIQPIIQSVVDFVMTIWGALVEWWSEINGVLLVTIIEVWEFIYENIITAVSAIVEFVMEIWAQLVAFWNEHGEMILQAAQNVWSIVQAIIIGAVTAIWDFIQMAFPVIQNIIQVAMDVIWNIMQVLWPIIRALIIDTWNAIKNTIQGAIDVITGIIQFFSALFTGNWSALWDSIKQIVSGAVQAAWGLINLWFVGKILKLGTSLFTGLRGIVTNIWNTVKSLFEAGINYARNLVSAGFNLIRSTISNVMMTVRNIISTVWNAITNVITTVVNGVGNTISNVFNSIGSTINLIMSSIRSVISSVWNSIRSTISTVVNGIRSTISSIFSSLSGIVRNAFSSVTSAVTTGIGNAYRAVVGKISDFFNAGRNIVTSIANGIKGAISKVTGAISGVVQKIRDFLPFSPAKEGPLKDIMYPGY